MLVRFRAAFHESTSEVWREKRFCDALLDDMARGHDSATLGMTENPWNNANISLEPAFLTIQGIRCGYSGSCPVVSVRHYGTDVCTFAGTYTQDTCDN